MFESFRVDGLCMSYGEHQVLSNVFFEGRAGEIAGILGVNGCGKSTLFNSLTVSRPDTGNVFINGEYLPLVELQEHIAYLPQVNFLPNDLTPHQCLDLFRIGAPGRERFWALERLRRLQHCKIATLSGGETRLVEFMLVNNLRRPIVILDEPFSEVEPQYEALIAAEIRAQRAQRLYIVSDHKYFNIQQLCTSLYLMTNRSLRPVRSSMDLAAGGYLHSGST